MTRIGTLNQIEEALAKLDEMNNKHPILNYLVQIEEAHELACEERSPKARKIEDYLGRISHALKEERQSVAFTLMMEIAPDVQGILAGLSTRKFTIHTELKEDSVS